MRLASVTKFGLMIASRVSTPWADTVIGTRVATKATIALASNARDQSDLRVMLVLLRFCSSVNVPAGRDQRGTVTESCGRPCVGQRSEHLDPPFSITIGPGGAPSVQ